MCASGAKTCSAILKNNILKHVVQKHVVVNATLSIYLRGFLIQELTIIFFFVEIIGRNEYNNLRMC